MTKFFDKYKMRAQEFESIQEYTVFDLHPDFFEAVAGLDSSLFENYNEFQAFKDQLRNFGTEQPKIGQSYVYVSVASTPVGRLINIAHFDQAYPLIDINNGRYIFDIHGQTRAFPESGSFDRTDSLQHIFTFDTVAAFERMLSWLILNYSQDNGWKISYKNLTKNL